jgi:hypothetical protein
LNPERVLDLRAVAELWDLPQSRTIEMLLRGGIAGLEADDRSKFDAIRARLVEQGT